MALSSTAKSDISQASGASLAYSAISNPARLIAEKELDKYLQEFDQGQSGPATVFAIGTPGASSAGTENRDSSMSVDRRGIMDSSIPEDAAHDPDEPPKKGPRPSTPRRTPSGSPQPPTAPVVRRTVVKSKSPSGGPLRTKLLQVVDQDEQVSLKRKLEESEQRNAELEKQIQEGRAIKDRQQGDQTGQPDSSRDSDALRKFLVGKMEIMKTENITLHEQVKAIEDGRLFLNEKVKKGKDEIQRLKRERELVASSALASDERYRLLSNSTDQRLMESKSAADASRAFYEEQMAGATDLQLQMQNAAAYIQQRHMTIMQYDEYDANVLRESGGLRSELEELRIQYKDNSTMWEDWHNSEMAAVCGEAAQAIRDKNNSIAYGIEMANSVQSTKLELQNTTSKLDEAKTEIRVHKSNVDSLELRLRNEKEKAGTPVGEAAKVEPIKIEDVEEMATTYETRIQEKRDIIHGLKGEIQAKDELLGQMQSEIIDASRRADLKDADMRRANPGMGAPVGAIPQKALEPPATADIPEKPKTQSQKMLEMLYKAKGAEGPANARERDEDEESYKSANEDKQVASEAGTNSIARLSQVGSEVQEKIPGKRVLTEISVGKFPRFNGLKAWITEIGRNLHIKSQFGDKLEIAWIKEVFNKTFEELADPGLQRFRAMDSVLIPELEKKLPPALHRDYVNKNKELDNDDNIIGGRQIIKMIVEYFHTADVHTMMYSYENLHELKWKGDFKVPEFMDAWVEIVDNLVVPLKPNNLRDMLHKKMLEGETKLFTLDLHQFQRQKDLSIET